MVCPQERRSVVQWEEEITRRLILESGCFKILAVVIKIKDLKGELEQWKRLQSTLDHLVEADKEIEITIETRKNGILAKLDHSDSLFYDYYQHLHRVIREVLKKAKENIDEEVENMVNKLDEPYFPVSKKL